MKGNSEYGASDNDAVTIEIEGEAQANALPDATSGHITVEDMIALTARLAQVMAKEADLLEDMKVSDIEGLQQEKIALTNALESVKKQFAKHPELLDEMDQEQEERLHEIVLLFNQICEENYRRLQVASRVNQELVGVISSIVKDEASKDVYDQKGVTGQPKVDAVSLSLNEKV